MAADEHNARGAEKIEVIVEDSQGDPAEGLKAFHRLTSGGRTRMVLGDLTSSVTLAIAPTAEKARVVVVAPGASAPAVRNAGEYIFRNWVADDFDATAAALFARNAKQWKRAAVLFIRNDYGAGAEAAFVRAFTSAGGSVALRDSFAPNETQFRSLITKVSRPDLDVIYIAAQPRELAQLLRQLRARGVRTTVLTNASAEERDFQTIAASAADGIYYTAPVGAPAPAEPAFKQFTENYRRRYNLDPDIVSMHAYDAAQMLFRCTSQRAPDEVRKCLNGLSEFKGVLGPARFDDHGDVLRPVAIKERRAGQALTIATFEPMSRSWI